MQRRWDGSWESGKAKYRNALVALDPLVSIKLMSGGDYGIPR